MNKGNILGHIPAELPNELVQVLTRNDSVCIERIVSRGHVSAPGFWYDQNAAEWVMVVSGAARIEFDDGSSFDLWPGDWIDIPAHCRHRVAWTDPESDTVWLAVHYAGDSQ